MNEKELKQIFALAKKLKAEKMTKESALASLVSAGIMTKSGNFNKNYSNLKRVVIAKSIA